MPSLMRRPPPRQKTRGNPLAAGLIAFGAGLLISSLIPSSQKEQEAVSTLQDNLEPLKEKVTEAAKDVGAQLKEPAQEAVESVKATATEGAENVKDEGVAAKDEVQGQVEDSKIDRPGPGRRLQVHGPGPGRGLQDDSSGPGPLSHRAT